MNMELPYTYWEDDGWLVGSLNAYPDHLTQGRTIAELEEMLTDVWQIRQEEEKRLAQNMGITRDEITLTNTGDIAKARGGYIPKKDIRSVTVTAVADSGALRLTIPESLREKLGLEILRKAPATLASGEKLEVGLSEGVEIRWKDRLDISQAWVVPRECAVLLGAMPMEGMDIMVDPKSQRLVGIHGNEELGILY